MLGKIPYFEKSNIKLFKWVFFNVWENKIKKRNLRHGNMSKKLFWGLNEVKVEIFIYFQGKENWRKTYSTSLCGSLLRKHLFDVPWNSLKVNNIFLWAKNVKKIWFLVEIFSHQKWIKKSFIENSGRL